MFCPGSALLFTRTHIHLYRENVIESSLGKKGEYEVIQESSGHISALTAESSPEKFVDHLFSVFLSMSLYLKM